MKHSDIQKVFEAGLITAEQRDRIIQQFNLREGTRFMTILVFLGAVLITAGIVLLISANWDEIHRAVKIGGGVLLMIGAHGLGYYLRSTSGAYPKAGEALHMAGSILFLANIALVGQIYNLSADPAGAFLVWSIGIAALPWILNSAAQFILLLVGMGIWFCMELGDPAGLFVAGEEIRILPFLTLLGVVYVGLGHWIRRADRWHAFAGSAERIGLLILQTFLFPLTWGIMDIHGSPPPTSEWMVFTLIAVVALLMVFYGLAADQDLNEQWKVTWRLSLAGIVLLAATVWIYGWQAALPMGAVQWITALVLAVFCLIEIQVGLQSRSPFMVNTGLVFFALTVGAVYFELIGTMANTGLMFLISGLFLIAFAIYLEKKRRGMMARIKTAH